MNLEELKNKWLEEENTSFKGWDFSHMDKRWLFDPLPWNYLYIIKNHLKKEHMLLDIGTGGGEFLISLEHPHHLTYATEGYKPNFELCQQTLSPLGINIQYVPDDNYLPFGNETFDIVIARHKLYVINEVNRILKPGGLFITQQIGGKNFEELIIALTTKSPPYNYYALTFASECLKDIGFDILYSDEAFVKQKFTDIGAIIFCAKRIQWKFADFSVEKYFDRLLKIHEICLKNGLFECTQHKFIVISQKPN